MKKLLLVVLLLPLFTACFAPINTSFESARMLKKGEVEAAGFYSHYAAAADGESDGINNNFGLRLGYGICDKFDLKLRYERIILVEEADSDPVNYLDIAPKYQIIPGKFAGTLPLGFYFADGESQFVLSPKLLFTYPTSDRFEITVASKADIFPDDETEVYLGFNLGLGISQNLNRWAIRPELGLMINPGEEGRYWAYGVAVTGVLGKRKENMER